MPKSHEPAVMHVDPASANDGCPKCGAEMEPIEVAVEELPIQQLHLCPSCYLVIWSDREGPHFRQGVPMSETVSLREKGDLSVGEPEKC